MIRAALIVELTAMASLAPMLWSSHPRLAVAQALLAVVNLLLFWEALV